jgi:hypothetical protein
VVGGSITRGVARDFQFCTAKLVVQRSGSGGTFVGGRDVCGELENADAVMTGWRSLGQTRNLQRTAGICVAVLSKLRLGYQLSDCYGSGPEQQRNGQWR